MSVECSRKNGYLFEKIYVSTIRTIYSLDVLIGQSAFLWGLLPPAFSLLLGLVFQPVLELYRICSGSPCSLLLSDAPKWEEIVGVSAGKTGLWNFKNIAFPHFEIPSCLEIL